MANIVDMERPGYGGIDPEVAAAWLATLDVADETKANYDLGFRRWCEFAERTSLDFDDLEEEDVIHFKDHLLHGERVSPRTASLYLSGVRSFYRFAEARGLENIARNVRGARKPRGHAKEALSAQQARDIIAAFDAEGDERELRDRAVVATLVYTGIRVIEAARASVRDIGHVGEDTVLHIWGKGRDEADAIVKIAPALGAILEDYLAVRGELSPSDPLFASCSDRNPGGRLTTRTMSSIASSALRRIGIDDPRYTAHSLRHTAGTLAYQAGASIEEVQAMLRHSDITTTMIYAHMADRLDNPAEDKIAEVLGDWPNAQRVNT